MDFLAVQGRQGTFVDLALAPDLAKVSGFYPLFGFLPEALEPLPSGACDRVLTISVLEYLWKRQETLVHFHRRPRPGGRLLVNVPSCRDWPVLNSPRSGWGSARPKRWTPTKPTMIPGIS